MVAIEKSQEARPSRSKKPFLRQENRQEKKVSPVLPPFLCGIKKATALLEQWVKDAGILLPHVDRLPFQVDQRDAKYCPFHRRKGTIWSNGWFSERSLVRNSRQEKSYSRIKELSASKNALPNHHNGKGKGQVLMVSTIRIDEDVTV